MAQVGCLGVEATVTVDGGAVRGDRREDVWRFLGVPYARAPSGELRWRPPVRPAPWRGVLDARRPGPLAPQAPAAAGTLLAGEPFEQDEDCLHLSVWTPGLDGARRPVLVWIHGGGFTSGTAGSVLYRGEALARRGDVVMVALNYRLGALGFLAHPALADGADGADGAGAPSANWALLDQIAALRWVREHVALFGGDPDNVTVFGESAGAMCIAALLAMPLARGLFARAVIQSGPPYVHDAARAAESAEALAAELGMRRVTRRALERVPAAVLVDALEAICRRGPRPGELPQQMLPVVDGRSLPSPPLDALAEGCARGVATIVGTNRDEMAFFVLSDPSMATLDDERLAERLALAAPGVDAGEVIAHYRNVRRARGEPVTSRDIWVAAGSDLVFRWPALRLAAAAGCHEPRTFVYLFGWESPAFGGALGACHALEIPFVFGTTDVPGIAPLVGAGPAATALSDAMQSAWLAFARTGDPSNEMTGPWEPWEPGRRATMVFGPRPAMEAAPRDEDLAPWEMADPLPRASVGTAGG